MLQPEMRKTNKETIAIIGLGKVGLPIAVCYTEKGFRVIGVDTDKSRLKLLQSGNPKLFEPSLQKLFSRNKRSITFTSDLSFAVKKSKALFVIVPTPSLKNGLFSLTYVLEVCKGIGQVLKSEKDWKLINIISTVIPGSMEKVIAPTLEKESGKRVGDGFGLCYSPEFVALGNVINIIFNPDFVLIGESDKESGSLLQTIKMRVIENNAPFHRTNFINAELAKIGSNTFITTKISFANMMARICEKIPNANVDTISTVLSDDSSIGGKRLIGGVSYGGPCYPRDNVALIAYANKIGADADIAQTTHRFNQKQTTYLKNVVLSKYKKNQVVGILGLSYKPDTDVVDESAGLKLAQKLIMENIPVIMYDPKAMENTKGIIGAKGVYAKNLKDCIDKSDIVVVTTPWPEFSTLNQSYWKNRKRNIVIIDCWRVLKIKNRNNITYIPFGIGPQNNSK